MPSLVVKSRTTFYQLRPPAWPPQNHPAPRLASRHATHMSKDPGALLFRFSCGPRQLFPPPSASPLSLHGATALPGRGISHATMRWFCPRRIIRLEIAITGDQVLTSADRPFSFFASLQHSSTPALQPSSPPARQACPSRLHTTFHLTSGARVVLAHSIRPIIVHPI